MPMLRVFGKGLGAEWGDVLFCGEQAGRGEMAMRGIGLRDNFQVASMGCGGYLKMA
ncbi:hypothetical protein H9Q10_03090 [Eikenella sp. S3360]|uniref:Uncharacterized protein n=1 Tax=Eikenella glucosivorans TaxID=2766967 RepID=A0ABS0N8R0_9NEIS|nr:hypothetical protein [Eikenella glucosivorans]MBH5328652.1 hypothetical protein [Eikenella glucosivorans]